MQIAPYAEIWQILASMACEATVRKCGDGLEISGGKRISQCSARSRVLWSLKPALFVSVLFQVVQKTVGPVPEAAGRAKAGAVP